MTPSIVKILRATSLCKALSRPNRRLARPSRYRHSAAFRRETQEPAVALDREARRPEHAGVSKMRRGHAAGVVRISLDALGALSASICDSARQQGLRDV